MYNCIRCGGTDFKRDYNIIYCGVCNFRITGELRKNISQLIPKNFDKKLYNKKYYEEKRGMMPGVSIKQAAIIKHCSVNTIRRNIESFDIIEGLKPVRLRFNNKFLSWQYVKNKNDFKRNTKVS